MYQTQQAAQEEASVAFKRFILDESSAFESEPEADFYRVSLLGRMLDRYDELRGQGMEAAHAIERVKAEHRDIDGCMRREGFALGHAVSAWPEMTEEEAALYMRQSNACAHKRALGAAQCAACCAPMMLMIGISECWNSDTMALLGVAAMFGMIGLGLYTMLTARRPKNAEKIRKGRFSMDHRLRKKLMQLSEVLEEKSRRRRARGIAMLVTCVIPVILGGMLENMGYSDACPIWGVGGMFALIGAGIYEIMMSCSEKKPIEQLLDRR